MKLLNNTFLLRLTVGVILIMHSVPGMFNGGVNNFGEHYLNQIGFAPVGIPIAWAIKLSHVAAAICLLLDKYVKWACLITISVLIIGIFMVHWKEGWYVVGGGRNGTEFNVLLIAVLVSIILSSSGKK